MQEPASPGQRPAVTPPPGPHPVARLERMLNRALVGVGLVAFVILWLLSKGQGVSPAFALALFGAFIVTKLVVLVLALQKRWRAWPAVALELAAFSLAAFVAWAGSRDVAWLLAIAALLTGAALLRRRATQQEADAGRDSPEP